MIYLTVEEVIDLQEGIILVSGGSPGIRDQGLIESAVAQPKAAFGGQEFYSTLSEKVAALGYSLAMNHAFIDGNKRIAHAAIEAFLIRNKHELSVGVDEQEATILQLASGATSRQEFEAWLRTHIAPLPQSGP
jgi:death-on-curing protein